jgi:N-acetylglucosamine-6-phosphate deacetylase
MSGSTVIRGRLVIADRVVPGRVVVTDGTIERVVLDDAESGPYICPGLVDVHIHGFGGFDSMDGPAALDAMARALLRRGVTSFVPTAVTAPLPTLRRFADDVRAWQPKAPVDGAQPLGFNLEGPFIEPARKGAQNPEHIRAPADVPRSELEPLLDGWRLVTMAPEVPGAVELIRWLAGHGVAISLGHSNASVEHARLAYAAGATSTTHLFNAMSGVDHRAPGLAAAALMEDSVWVEFVADGQHIHPALWPLIARMKPRERLALVTDAVSLAGTGDGRGVLGGLDVEVRGDRCTLVEGGVLAGSVISLDTAVRNLARSGLGLPLAVAAATANPLALIGVSDRGHLVPGQRADLLELDDDLRVLRVMLGGVSFDGAT